MKHNNFIKEEKEHTIKATIDTLNVIRVN